MLSCPIPWYIANSFSFEATWWKVAKMFEGGYTISARPTDIRIGQLILGAKFIASK